MDFVGEVVITLADDGESQMQGGKTVIDPKTYFGELYCSGTTEQAPQPNRAIYQSRRAAAVYSTRRLRSGCILYQLERSTKRRSEMVDDRA